MLWFLEVLWLENKNTRLILIEKQLISDFNSNIIEFLKKPAKKLTISFSKKVRKVGFKCQKQYI